MTFEIYDLETLSNLFTYTGYDYKEEKWYQFVISNWRNDLDRLIEHLNSLKTEAYQIGYNNEDFDYPIVHHIIRNYSKYQCKSGQGIAQNIYEKAQDLINSDSKFKSVRDSEKYIKQIDLFKIWHFNNQARRTSLKDLEIVMDMDNVEEMPIHHTTWCKQGDEECVLSYNKNDVWATKLFFEATVGKTDYPLYIGENRLQLREALSRQFGLPCMNYPDVKIGEELIVNLYCKKTGKNKYDLKKQGGTKRNSISLKECIPHWAKFESKEFNEIKRKFENATISNIKGEFSNSVIFHGIRMDYGTGGIHSSAKPGIYESDEYWVILDEDVGLA